MPDPTDHTIPSTPTPTELQHPHADWQAANDPSVGQNYLLKAPLTLAHIGARSLGHRRTTLGPQSRRLHPSPHAPHRPRTAPHRLPVRTQILNAAGQP